jgi:hypothetical protein
VFPRHPLPASSTPPAIPHNPAPKKTSKFTRTWTIPFAFRDIVYGTYGINIGSFAAPSWDFRTGVGTPSSYHGK